VEGGVAVCENNDSHADKTDPGTVRLEVSAGKQVVSKGVMSCRRNRADCSLSQRRRQ